MTKNYTAEFAKESRKKLNLKQKQLSEILGISMRYISAVENDKLRPKPMYYLAIQALLAEQQEESENIDYI